MGPRDFIALLGKWWVDDVVSEGFSRPEAKRRLANILKPPPSVIDRDTWGLSPDAIAGQDRALKLVT